jgi:mRNA interferase HigB
MRIISVKRLREFWKKHPDAEQPLRIWYGDVRRSSWRNSSDVKASYSTASFLAGNRVVFNIRGNNYRLIVAIAFRSGIVYIRFVGTHEEYDRIDPTKI